MLSVFDRSILALSEVSQTDPELCHVIGDVRLDRLRRWPVSPLPARLLPDAARAACGRCLVPWRATLRRPLRHARDRPGAGLAGWHEHGHALRGQRGGPHRRGGARRHRAHLLGHRHVQGELRDRAARRAGGHPGADPRGASQGRHLPGLSLLGRRGHHEGAQEGAGQGADDLRGWEPGHLAALRGEGSPRLPRARGPGGLRDRGLDPRPLAPGRTAQPVVGWARVRRMRAWMSRTRSCSKSICTSLCSTSQWLTVENQPNRRPWRGTRRWPR